MAEPEYGSDEYLLKKWAYLLDDLDPGWRRTAVARMLEEMWLATKTPIQILAEEATRNIDE